MNKKSRLLSIITIVALAMAIATGPGLGQSNVHASHIDIFDMNTRIASEDFPYSGSGVSVVTGNNIDFRVVAEGLEPMEIYSLDVKISKTSPVTDGFATISFAI